VKRTGERTRESYTKIGPYFIYISILNIDIYVGGVTGGLGRGDKSVR